VAKILTKDMSSRRLFRKKRNREEKGEAEGKNGRSARRRMKNRTGGHSNSERGEGDDLVI